MAGRDKSIWICWRLYIFHSGMTGFADAVYNGTNMTMVILDNRITAMTGQQDNPIQ